MFHYFRSKADLYRAVVEKGFSEAEVLVRQALDLQLPPLEKARALVASYVELVATHRERATIFLRQALGDAPPDFEPAADARRILDVLVAYIRQQQEAGVYAAVDPVALVLGVVGMVAFFFTSARVIGSVWDTDPWSLEGIQRLRDHVSEAVVRWLTPAADREAVPASASGGRT